MIKTVETFDHNFEIKFNADKSMMIIFNKNKKSISCSFQFRDRIKSFRKEVRLTKSNENWQRPIVLNGTPIPEVESMRYRGYFF